MNLDTPPKICILFESEADKPSSPHHHTTLRRTAPHQRQLRCWRRHSSSLHNTCDSLRAQQTHVAAVALDASTTHHKPRVSKNRVRIFRHFQPRILCSVIFLICVRYRVNSKARIGWSEKWECTGKCGRVCADGFTFYATRDISNGECRYLRLRTAPHRPPRQVAQYHIRLAFSTEMKKSSTLIF